MNLKNIALGAFALSIVSSAIAGPTIEITGATAFRTATLNTIKARFEADPSPSYKYAFDAPTLIAVPPAAGFSSTTRATFIGKYPGIDGTTTIRCSFNGSVEGIRALVTPGAIYNPEFIPVANVTAPLGTAASDPVNYNANVSAKEQAAAEFAFSDVNIASTPEDPTDLASSDATVGVVVFSMIASESAPATLTNISGKQFQALFGAGKLPVRVLTGDLTSTRMAYATGRNDGSGTRTTYMAETGLGITASVNQYTVLTTSGDNITSIQKVPAGGANDSNSGLAGIQPYPGQSTGNASTIWGNDVDGNGGFASGSTLVGHMARTSNGVQVRDADYSVLEASQDIVLVSFLSQADAASAVKSGAKILGYNGVTLSSITPTNSVLDAADKAKVTEGAYTAWSNQQFYRRGDNDTDTVAIYTDLFSAIPNNIGSSGIKTTDMHVIRGVDGGTVAP